ncbi:salicylate hydroxylase [Flammula alnicola]|nr:salicylate hydroxylase [Flammula alnicola]
MNTTTNDNTANQKLRVAIIGAGIGGLTLSAALGILDHERNLEVDIYESTAHITEVGAGIGFWPRTWEIMRALGVEKKINEFLPEIPDDGPHIAFQIRKSDQKEGFHVQDVMIQGPFFRLHRADLQQILLSQMSGRLHLSHRLSSFEETEKEVRLHFLDGTTATCDILIGMDGIKSAVRSGLLLKTGLSQSLFLDPVWSGTVAYRGLVPAENIETVFPGHRAINTPMMMYLGKLKHLIVYPVAHEKTLLNIVAFVSDPSKEGTVYDGPSSVACTQEEILSAFSGFEPEVQVLLRGIDHPSKWAINALVPLERYASGRVLVAGDAAHAMPPHQGAGAGQAIEDAYILANLLCHKLSTKEMVPKVSEVYNAVRSPEGNRVLQGSILSGRLADLVSPGFENVKEGDTDVPLEKLQELAGLMGKEWDWVWKSSAEGDRKRALEMLESELLY